MGLRSLAPVLRVGGRSWISLDARTAALAAAMYTLVSSVVVTALYVWRMSVNLHQPDHLQEVYYGVQISYLSTAVTHVSLAVLSGVLASGVLQERLELVTPWVVSSVSFMALEAVCCVYSNVLRNHVNKGFDELSRAEMWFLVVRFFFNVLALSGVMAFFRNIRGGLTYRDPEAIEL